MYSKDIWIYISRSNFVCEILECIYYLISLRIKSNTPGTVGPSGCDGKLEVENETKKPIGDHKY